MSAMEPITGIRDVLIKIVDPENIKDDNEILGGYVSDISYVDGVKPLLVVYPRSKGQVQEIVRLASESRVPLVPVSSGNPRFHGDTIPCQEAIIINFSRMNSIMKIDAINRYAMVEPGVTYGELIPQLREKGLRLSAPLLPRKSKSVLTSRLEREPVIIPKYQYDYVDPLLTLEVVYGTGDDFRTGSASGPGTLQTLKADKVNPWGPGPVDFFRFVSGAQGTMGLVTWIITKTEVLPSLQKLFFIPADDIRATSLVMNRLLRKRIVDECLALNNVNLAAMLAESWPEDFQELKKNLSQWTVIVCIAGYRRRPEERVDIQENNLIKICGGLGFKPRLNLPGAEGKEIRMLELLTSAWEKEPYWKLCYKNTCHDIFFLTTLTKIHEFFGLMINIARKWGYPIGDIGCYLQPMVQGRGCHCEFNIPCDSSNNGEVATVKDLFMDASQTLIDNGAFFSRPYGPWAGMVFRSDAENVKALRKIKDIFDPNHILNPGKLCF